MKKRLDLLVYEQGAAPSREKARGLIMSGLVYVDNQKADKPGDMYPESAKVEVRGKGLPYVSRGGLKLEKAMKVFSLELSDAVCMDVGASTGGFTDCMLQNGAKKVYAIDVGYGQLAWGLRQDPRVVNLERTNARYLTKEQVPEAIDFMSVDVSFISLSLILPAVRPLLGEEGRAVCLIKPQFEAGREKVGKKGVVRDKAVHREVIEKALGFSLENGFSVRGLTYSPVKGPEGNIEYLAYLQKAERPRLLEGVGSPKDVVEASHQELDK
ncbi:TlyA family RNA methyltransferase [Oscillospiraceae bacterium 21-37]